MRVQGVFPLVSSKVTPGSIRWSDSGKLLSLSSISESRVGGGRGGAVFAAAAVIATSNPLGIAIPTPRGISSPGNRRPRFYEDGIGKEDAQKLESIVEQKCRTMF